MDNILLNVVFLAVGFVLLIKGADYFVDGAAAAAKLMKISTLVIGLTVVAFGTSAPELAVSLAAAVQGSNSIALGNVVGSNILNFYLILGISAVITPIVAKKEVLTRDYTISLIAAALVLVLGFIGLRLGRIDGIILAICIIAYVAFLIVSSKKSGAKSGDGDFKTLTPIKCVLYIILGLAAVVAGGELVVTGAKTIAKFLGMSEALIALTVVALGTSLPELVTSVMAAKKGETDLALGNVLGSNIFNLLFILGVSSAVHPMVPDADAVLEYKQTLVDLGIFLIASIIFFFPIWKNKRFTRGIGIALIIFYAAYFAFIMMRNYGVITLPL